MRPRIAVPTLLALALLVLVPVWTGIEPSRPESTSVPPAVSICFTPGGACDSLLVQALDAARSSIRVAAYSFTSAPIADALIAAHARGVDVQVVLDAGRRNGRGHQGGRLRQAGVDVRYDAEHAIMHNKFVVLDLATVITGSYNYTSAAQKRNAENMAFIRDAAVAEEYAREWERHWGHSSREGM